MIFHRIFNSADVFFSQKLLFSKCAHSGLDTWHHKHHNHAHSGLDTCAVANGSQIDCGYSHEFIMDKRKIICIYQTAAKHRSSCLQYKTIDLLERSIKLITVHFHHPVKLIITYFICILINCMLSRVVVGGPHNIIKWLQVYFDMMVIISIFAHKKHSLHHFSHHSFYKHKKIPPRLPYFVLLTFGKLPEKGAVSIRPVVTCSMYFTRIKRLDGKQKVRQTALCGRTRTPTTELCGRTRTNNNRIVCAYTGHSKYSYEWIGQLILL